MAERILPIVGIVSLGTEEEQRIIPMNQGSYNNPDFIPPEIYTWISEGIGSLVSGEADVFPKRVYAAGGLKISGAAGKSKRRSWISEGGDLVGGTVIPTSATNKAYQIYLVSGGNRIGYSLDNHNRVINYPPSGSCILSNYEGGSIYTPEMYLQFTSSSGYLRRELPYTKYSDTFYVPEISGTTFTFGTELQITNYFYSWEYFTLYSVYSTYILYAGSSYIRINLQPTSSYTRIYLEVFNNSTSIYASVLLSTWVLNQTYKIVVNYDTTQSIESDRIKFYVDDILQEIENSVDLEYPSQNYTLYFPGSNFREIIYQNIGAGGPTYGYASSKALTKYSIYIDGLILNSTELNSEFKSPYGPYGWNLSYSSKDYLGYDSKRETDLFIEQSNVVQSNPLGYVGGILSIGFVLFFEILYDNTPVQDKILSFILISGESIELNLPLEVLIDPLEFSLPLKLYGEGVPVELILPLNLVWIQNVQFGTYTSTDTVQVNSTTSSILTYQNLSNVEITDSTNTIFYDFGTSPSDANSINGWINIITGEVTVFTLEQQLANNASNVIYDNSLVNVNYDYNLPQSNISWTVTSSLGDLIGEVSVEYEEDASTIAKFSILVSSGIGIEGVLDYVGKPVSLSVSLQGQTGSTYSGGQLFTGIISEVELDVDRGILNLTADTQMPAYFNALSREEIEALIGGIWSEQVWDNTDDSTGWTYAQERLSTTENILWHDENGQLRINNFINSEGPEFNFTDNERFHESLKVEFAQRSEMVNQIRIDLNYSYPRRRQRNINFKWSSHSAGSLSGFLCDGNSYQLCQRTMVEGAASGSSWIPISRIEFDPIWPAQSVNCGGGLYDTIVWGMSVVDFYTPNPQNPNHVATNVDTGETVNDRTMGFETLTPPEVSNALCIGARWKTARRWIQDMTEYYEFIVQCQDSIDKIGVVASTESYSIDSGIEDDSWADSIIPYNEQNPSGSNSIPGSQDLYWNVDEITNSEDVFDREDFELAQQVVLTAARIDILKAHRLSTVSFKVPYTLIGLDARVNVTSPYVNASGKAKKVTHYFSFDTGEASTEINVAVFSANGSGLQEDDPLTPLERPEPITEEPLPYYVQLNNYIGGRVHGTIGFTGKWYEGRADGEYDEENDVWIKEPWEGFMTNFEWPVTSTEYAGLMSGPAEFVSEGMWNYYMQVAAYTIPYQFVVKGPDIDEQYTTGTLIKDTQIINVNLPN